MDKAALNGEKYFHTSGFSDIFFFMFRVPLLSTIAFLMPFICLTYSLTPSCLVSLKPLPKIDSPLSLDTETSLVYHVSITFKRFLEAQTTLLDEKISSLTAD